MGSFISFFDNDSRIDIISTHGEIPSIYFFGSIQAFNLNILNRNVSQEYVVDNRQACKDGNSMIEPSNIDNQVYLNTLVPYFIEVYK
ncbi:MAG: hypothetical protein RMJ36_01130 [Candidatus Calescibacterium sp.]|nr:hypothetical protein [Candidatus Calescibacterium sp.]MDW8132243.1 hypothetical protein [Candidatus Calescibacterium sp.]